MITEKLLTRDDFRKYIFLRDHNTCVVPGCVKEAVDAHHIYERKLWSDGGYYLCNGASLCEEHHKLAERNKISPSQLREYCKIKGFKLPSQLDRNKEYDKWGKELLHKQSTKYPTTFYLPFSSIPSEHTKDIGVIKHLLNAPLVITKKMDGSNVLIMREKVTARNGYSATHKSFDMLKARHAQFKLLIPENICIFGEWVYAKHSIKYDNLEDYLQIFAAYDKNTHEFLNWESVVLYAKLIGCITTPVIKKATYTKEFEMIKDLTEIAQKVIKEGGEGIVVRNYFGYHISQFSENVMKYVRPNHVQTDVHWREQKIERNKLK